MRTCLVLSGGCSVTTNTGICCCTAALNVNCEPQPHAPVVGSSGKRTRIELRDMAPMARRWRVEAIEYQLHGVCTARRPEARVEWARLDETHITVVFDGAIFFRAVRKHASMPVVLPTRKRYPKRLNASVNCNDRFSEIIPRREPAKTITEY